MKLKIFSIYDAKAKAYLPPFFLPNEAMAIRTFKDCCNSDQHQFGAHPEDYTLFEIGIFSDETAMVTSNIATTTAINGLTLVDSNKQTGNDNEQVSHETSIQPSAESGDPT